MSRVSAIISCCHTGPNPAPGVGIARSLRAAYPDCLLIGKDQSTQSSGLHSEFFDDIWVALAWNEINLDLHRRQIDQRLKEMDGFYLPGSDLEARWLAQEGHGRILSPPLSAFERTAKPFKRIAGMLPAKVPDFIPLNSGSRDIYNFAVAHDWDLWAKGPVMDAYRVSEWSQVISAHSQLTSIWGRQDFFLQHHVPGHDVSVAFAAYAGRLLGTAFMEKRMLTNEGKCWAGEVTDCPSDLADAVASVVRELNWTGGGEIEFVRDDTGALWLIDWNYRFPAWIHGATIAGINLPARLIAAASGLPARPERRESGQFTRLVLEMPVQEAFPLPGPPPPSQSTAIPSKLSVANPAALPQLMRRLFGGDESPGTKAKAKRSRSTPPDSALSSFEGHLLAAADSASRTPTRVLLPEVAQARMSLTAQAAEAANRVRLRPAYSIKTNPDHRLMDMARRHGFLAEAISAEEALWARARGFTTAETVYNGPVPLEPERLGGEMLHAVFADSLEGFQRLCGHSSPPAETVGVRLNGFRSGSRFGLDLMEADRFVALADTIADRLPAGTRFGIHHHLQSSTIGVDRWLRHTRAAIELARSLEYVSGHPVRTFDLGGGWESESFGLFLADHLPGLLDHIQDRLPAVDEVIIEPGKAICEQSAVLVTRVLEVREKGEHRDIVVDACLAEIPLAIHFPREVYHISAGGRIIRLPFGQDRILGRVCMEHDILAGAIDLPADVADGSMLVFTHAGAYEASMSFTFGVGGA